METALLFTGRFHTGQSSGFVWKTERFFPAFVPPEQTARVLKAAQALGELSKLLGTRIDELLPSSGTHGFDVDQGVLCSDLGPTSSLLTRSLVLGAESVTRNEDARVQLSFNAYVKFSSADGASQSFLLKSARQGGRLPTLRVPKRDSDSSRLPRELKLTLSQYGPMIPGNGSLPTLKQLSESMSRSSNLKIYVDQRMANDRLFIRPGKGGFSMADQALGIACAMDMYWRKVGDVYILAISPADPRELMWSRYLARISSSMAQFTASIARAGLMPAGISAETLLADALPLQQLSAEEIRQIVECIQFSDVSQSNTFQAMMRNPNYQKGTVKFISASFATVSSNEGHAILGGNVVTTGN